MLGDMRAFFATRGVIEVQTPVLGSTTVTDPHVPSIAVAGHGFLQSSPEYFMKRLLAAGVPSCFQIAPAFRADERGKLHNPEFQLLEWYRVGFDHDLLMAEVTDLVDTLLGPAQVRRVRYRDLVPETDMSPDAQDLAFSDACAALSGRWFVVDYPVDQAVLARALPRSPDFAARFELVIDGVEVANGYWELTDPDVHRSRFADDNAARRTRGLPDVAWDEAFLDAIAAGLPDCAGVALGVDRLLMLRLGKHSLDGVLSFR